MKAIISINIISIILLGVSTYILHKLDIIGSSYNNSYASFLEKNKTEIGKRYFEKKYVDEDEYNHSSHFKIFKNFNIKSEIYYIYYNNDHDKNDTNDKMLMVYKDIVRIYNKDKILNYFASHSKGNIINNIWRSESDLIYKKMYFLIDRITSKISDDDFYTMGYVTYSDEKKKAYFISDKHDTTSVGSRHTLYDICLMKGNDIFIEEQ